MGPRHTGPPSNLTATVKFDSDGPRGRYAGFHGPAVAPIVGPESLPRWSTADGADRATRWATRPATSSVACNVSLAALWGLTAQRGHVEAGRRDAIEPLGAHGRRSRRAGSPGWRPALCCRQSPLARLTARSDAEGPRRGAFFSRRGSRSPLSCARATLSRRRRRGCRGRCTFSTGTQRSGSCRRPGTASSSRPARGAGTGLSQCSGAAGEMPAVSGRPC
jgi:hypothetical protein